MLQATPNVRPLSFCQLLSALCLPFCRAKDFPLQPLPRACFLLFFFGGTPCFGVPKGEPIITPKRFGGLPRKKCHAQSSGRLPSLPTKLHTGLCDQETTSSEAAAPWPASRRPGARIEKDTLRLLVVAKGYRGWFTHLGVDSNSILFNHRSFQKTISRVF